MPTTLYGPGDNFDLLSSHVLPALIRKTYDAKKAGRTSLDIWGSGTPRREFLHVDDLAEALIVLLEHYSEERPINVGSGSDIAIANLAQMVMDIAELEGKLSFDTAKPDGTPRKLLDSSRINRLGWAPQISLRNGIAEAYQWYANRAASGS